MSTTTTVRPTGTPSSNAITLGGGAVSANAALSDNSDTTYVLPNALGNFAYLDLGSLTLAANERIEMVRYGVRTRVDTIGKFADYIINFYDPVTGVESPREQQWAAESSYRTDYFGWRTENPNGSIWSQTDIDAIQVRIGSLTHTSSDYTYARFAELYVQVQVDTRPTVTSVVVGTLSSSKPTFTYVWNDADGDQQTKRRVKVFSSAQYSAGGFDPETSAATWDSGEVSSTLSAGTTGSGTVGVNLAAGTAYRLYVKGARAFWTTDWYSDWAFGAFTTAVSLPEVPVLTSTADNVNSRVQLDVQARINALSAQDSSLEATGVGNWANVANANLSRVTTDASHGTGSLQLSSVAAGNMSARIASAGRPSAVAGQQWTGVADFRAGATARSTRVDLEFYNAGGTIIGSATTGTAGNDATGSYTQRTVAATAPALTASVSIVVNVLATAAAAELHRVDRIGLTPGASTTWGLGGYLPTASHVIEYSDDAGATWTEATWLEDPVDAADQFDTVYDYSAPRGSARQYRARTQIATPTEVTSNPSNVDSETLALPAAGGVGMWWMKALTNPAMNFAPLVATLSQTITEDVDVFRTQGRGYPIVVAGDMGGYDGQVTIRTYGAAQWASMRAFLRLQTPFLLQAPDGEQFYIRIMADRGIERQPSPAGNVIRQVSVSYVEVELT